MTITEVHPHTGWYRCSYCRRWWESDYNMIVAWIRRSRGDEVFRRFCDADCETRFRRDGKGKGGR